MLLTSFLILITLLLVVFIKTKMSVFKSCLVLFIICILLIVLYIYRYSRYIFEKRKDKTISNKIIPKKNEPLPIGKTLSLSEFLSYDVPSSGKDIPLLFFRTSPFTLDNMPKEIINVLQNTLEQHPRATQIYLDNEDCDFFIHHFYPQHEPYYNSVRPGAFKADIIRVLLLYHFGGIYNDIGHIYLEPIDWIIKKECVFVKDISLFDMNTTLTNFGIHNSFMACYKEHPIMLHILNYIMDNVKHKKYGLTCLDITGPQAVKKALNQFIGKPSSFDLPSGLYKYKDFLIYTLVLTLNYTLNTDKQNLTILHKNNKIIQCKFNNYYKIMYHNRSTIPYPELWFAGLVYH